MSALRLCRVGVGAAGVGLPPPPARFGHVRRAGAGDGSSMPFVCFRRRTSDGGPGQRISENPSLRRCQLGGSTSASVVRDVTPSFRKTFRRWYSTVLVVVPLPRPVEDRTHGAIRVTQSEDRSAPGIAAGRPRNVAHGTALDLDGRSSRSTGWRVDSSCHRQRGGDGPYHALERAGRGRTPSPRPSGRRPTSAVRTRTRRRARRPGRRSRRLEDGVRCDRRSWEGRCTRRRRRQDMSRPSRIVREMSASWSICSRVRRSRNRCRTCRRCGGAAASSAARPSGVMAT